MTRPAETFEPTALVAPGTVYFAGGCDEIVAIKIGFTAGCPRARCRKLSLASPVELVVLAAVPGTLALEAAYHRRFARLRLHGEWFKPHESIWDEIDAIKLEQAPALAARQAAAKQERLEVKAAARAEAKLARKLALYGKTREAKT